VKKAASILGSAGEALGVRMTETRCKFSNAIIVSAVASLLGRIVVKKRGNLRIQC